METRNPYKMDARETSHGCLAKAGMTIVEMVVWLAVMAVLSVGMIWLLATVQR